MPQDHIFFWRSLGSKTSFLQCSQTIPYLFMVPCFLHFLILIHSAFVFSFCFVFFPRLYNFKALTMVVCVLVPKEIKYNLKLGWTDPHPSPPPASVSPSITVSLSKLVDLTYDNHKASQVTMGKHEVVQTLMMCSAQSCCGKNAKNTQNKQKPKKKQNFLVFYCCSVQEQNCS